MQPSGYSTATLTASFPWVGQMYQLTALADETHAITIQTDGKQVVVKAPLAPLTRSDAERLQEDPMSLGTVRGRVETLSRRKNLSFNRYELTSDTAVMCYMDWDLEDKMRDVWGHIADVTGTVRRDAKTDRPISIRRVTTGGSRRRGRPRRLPPCPRRAQEHGPG